MNKSISVTINAGGEITQCNKAFIDWSKSKPNDYNSLLELLSSSQETLDDAFSNKDAERASLKLESLLKSIFGCVQVQALYDTSGKGIGLQFIANTEQSKSNSIIDIDIFANIGSFEHNLVTGDMRISKGIRHVLGEYGALENTDLAAVFTEESVQKIYEIRHDPPQANYEVTLELRQTLKGVKRLFIQGEILRGDDGVPLISKGLVYNEEKLNFKQLSEQAIQSVELLYKANLNSQIGFWDVNLETNEIRWDEITRQIHGVDIDYIPTVENTNHFYEEGPNRALISKLFSDCIESGKPYETRLQIIDANGQKKWIYTSGQIGYIGGERHVYGIFKDIDEAATKDIELDRLYTAVNNLKQGIVITDKEGKAIYINKSVATISGYSQEEMIGKKPGAVLQGNGTNRKTILQIRNALRNRETIETEILNYTKGGEPFWNHLFISPYHSIDGGFEGYIGIQFNVTQEKEKNQEIEFLSNILARVNNPIAVVREDLSIAWSNKTFNYTVNISKDSSGLVIDELIQKLKVNENHKSFKEIIKGKKRPFKLEMDAEIKGQRTYFETFITPTKINNKLYYVSIFNIINQRVKYLDALKSETARLNYIVKSSNLGTFSYDKARDVLIVNRRFNEIIGIDHDEQKEETLDFLFEQVHPEDRRNYTFEINKLLSGESDKLDSVVRTKHRNGHTVWVRDQGEMVHGNQFYGVRSDYSLNSISQRLISFLGSINYSDAPLENIYQLCKFASEVLEIDYVYVAEAKGLEAKLLSGYYAGERLETFKYELTNTPCDIARLDGDFCFYASGVQHLFPKDELLVEMGVEGYFGLSIADRNDQQNFIVALKKKAITNQDQIAHFFDSIKERIQALLKEHYTAQKLELSQRTFSELTNITPIGIIETKNRVVEFANPSAAKILGKSSDELIGESIDQLFPQLSNYRVNEVFEYQAITDNNSYTRFLLLNHANLDSSGKLEIFTISDITNHQETQLALMKTKEELEIMNLDLEKRIQSRTKKLQEQHDELNEALVKLKKTQSAIVESEKLASLGTLTAGIAHELNNPLNFILNSANLLEDTVKSSTKDSLQLELINYIKEGAVRSNNIVRSLTNFSRNPSSDKEKVNPQSIIDNCLVVLNHQLKNKAEIRKNYEGECEILGNESQLHQVFLNIIANAMQAIDHNHGVIEIGVRHFRNAVIIEIKDNGKGIPANILNRIRDPFFTTKKGSSGTGLGLSIVSKIIDDHDAQLDYDSEVGVGTTAKITFIEAD